MARPRRGEMRAVVIEVLLSALVALMSSLIVFLTVQLLRLLALDVRATAPHTHD